MSLLSYWCQREACTRCQTPECTHHCHRESDDQRIADRLRRVRDRGDRLRRGERPGPGDGLALLQPGGGPAATRAEPGHHTSGIPGPGEATPPPSPPQPTRDRGPGERSAGDPRGDLARAAAAIWKLYRDADAHAHADWPAFHPWSAFQPAAAQPHPGPSNAHAHPHRQPDWWWVGHHPDPGSDPDFMDSTYSDAVGHWHRYTSEHTAELLTQPFAHALAHIANVTIHECIGEVARLRAELDAYQGRTVHYCTEGQMMDAASGLALTAQHGDILRATDSGREWQFRNGEWAERGVHG